jgi:hypothetical protein
MERALGSVGYPGEFRGLLRFVNVHQTARDIISNHAERMFPGARPFIRQLGYLPWRLWGNAMKNKIREFLSIDTLILAVAGIWFMSIILNLVT